MIEKIKKTIEVLSAPIVAVAAIWGVDIAGVVAATVAFLISALTYAEFWIEYIKAK